MEILFFSMSFHGISWKNNSCQMENLYVLLIPSFSMIRWKTFHGIPWKNTFWMENGMESRLIKLCRWKRGWKVDLEYF